MMEHLTCLPWVTTNECVQMTYFTNPWEFTSVCGGYIGTCYIKFWTYRQTAWFFSLMRLSSHASSALFSQRFVAHLSRRYMRFYPNVTTLRSGLCCRNSVCLSVCRLSVCLSVCNVGAPYSRGWSFRQNFFTAVYAGHPLTSVQNFTQIVLGEPLSRGR